MGLHIKKKKGEFEVVLKKSFSWRSNLSNDNIISAYARSENRCVKCQFWGLKKGSGFGEPGGTPPVRIPAEYPKRGIFEKKKLSVATHVDSSSPTFGSLYVFRS